jgi:hypothetical protein
MFHRMEQTQPTKPERTENQLLGHALTPDGWREVRWRDGKEVEIDPIAGVKIDKVSPLHKKFRTRHNQMLMAFMEAVDQVKATERKTPILREELMEKLKFDKQILKDLISFKLLEQHVIPVSKGKQKMGGRAVIIPTLEARKIHKMVQEALKDVTDRAADAAKVAAGDERKSEETSGDNGAAQTPGQGQDASVQS